MMMNSWWWVWMIVMGFLLVSPVGYGWGYRGWGPPYPRYVQRRRSEQLVASGATGPFKHDSWGLGGDFIYVIFFIGLLWVPMALFWTQHWFR